MKICKKMIAVFALIMIIAGVFAPAASAAGAKNYVLLGDSIAYGQGLANSQDACYGRIVANTNGYNYANYSVDGYTSGALLKYLDVDFVAAGVRKAVIYSYMPWCDEVYTDTVQFNVSLPSSIVEARFDDVLAFLSTDYNNGYIFTSYQWYINGEAVEGATGSWYYQPGMDKDAEITVRATEPDGTVVWVCPFTFNTAARPQALEMTETETKVYKFLRNGQLIIQCNGHIYNAIGQILE